MQNKKTTLKTVAQYLGVSTATVSNAFNRPNQLSKALREKILSECENLGYSGPSITARSLRTGKTGVIGLLLADNLAFNFTDPVATEFLTGISQLLDQEHVNMLMLPSTIENYQNTQVETIPDSFIVYGKPMDANVMNLITRQRKPLVTVDFCWAEMPSINVDNEQACYDIACHAIRSPQDKILILGLRLESTNALALANLDKLYTEEESVSRCRFEGYKRAIRDKGAVLEIGNVWQIHELEKNALKTMLRGALTSPQRADVLLCMSDKIALAALEVTQELDLRVPQEIRIVGFDDIPAAEPAGLTTVRQPIMHKGQLAAQMAMGQIPYQTIVLDTELIHRSTT
ncbi:transcriptional regulator [Vibrio galatheae]|uniref:Transcriptional regulator n=1 Tax=Vibrio galatheae TaxID=579748 RepID=A0A0F4NFG1_9VIBR|nr:LacI family DNA-binding transcriptional regulator [Vibrio galatheae]KJY81850.1 transcriptional regulator [Vibrio galatheae]